MNTHPVKRVSPQTMLGLLPSEMNMLGTLSPKKVREATRVHPDTLREGIVRGSFRASVAFKLRDFLKSLNR